MLSVSHYGSSLFSSIHYNSAMDGFGTIDPAALNTPAASTVSPSYITQSSPRGRKRSRSPDAYADLLHGDDGDGDDSKPRKRGRPPKGRGVDSPTMPIQPLTPATPTTNIPTPHIKTTNMSQTSPIHASPQHSTPGSAGKQPVLKALPTVRDHTTDQLNAENDEYLAREKDDAGENKVSGNGYLVDREYRIRTFQVPNRGEKLFMLATECARVLGYRDSYLLFNKNRSLYKIIASQPEKDNLIAQEILPYSYRSRQIAIVTARSMFRQFGSRVIVNGRRVRDDYWESKARKQGFTEEDAAGEKRPGAAKQREAQAAEASTVHALTALPHGEIIYSNAPGLDQPAVPPGIHPVTLASLPMASALSPDDLRSQDFPHIIRPRQEISGPAYNDSTRSSNASDILNQASNAAEFNKQLTQQRVIRSKYYDDYWKRPHDVPEPAQQQGGPDMDLATIAPQSIHSPQAHNPNMSALTAHQNMLAHQQNASHLMSNQNYTHQQQQHQQGMLSQSPSRSMHQSLPSAQMPQSSPAMSMATMGGRQQTPSYSYPTAGGMWPPPQPQPSPHAMPQYGQQQHTPQPHQSPMHPPSQLPHQSSNMGYPGMGNTMGNPAAYGANMPRNMYQPSPSPQQFSMGAQQPGMQGWAPPNSMAGDWQRFQ